MNGMQGIWLRAAQAEHSENNRIRQRVKYTATFRTGSGY